MKRTLAIIAVLLTIAIVVILLITRNMDNTYSDDQSQSKEDNNTMVEKADQNLHFTLEEINTEDNADEKKFKYTITNEGDKEQKLSFTTSQRYEYEISNKEEEVIHKYSDGRAFMQVLKDVVILPGEALSYDITTPQLDEGEYTLTTYLVAQSRCEISKPSINFSIND